MVDSLLAAPNQTIQRLSQHIDPTFKGTPNEMRVHLHQLYVGDRARRKEKRKLKKKKEKKKRKEKRKEKRDFYFFWCLKRGT